MFFIRSFVLIVILVDALVFANIFKVQISPIGNCDHLIPLGKSKSTYINSPNYPRKYTPNSSCRYIITAPLDYEINAQCNIDLYKGESNCTTELFYISTEGDRDLNDGEYFCGKGYIQRKSFFRTLVIAYTSNSSNNGGSFNCLVETIPQQCECGWTIPISEEKFHHGEKVKINEYPFVVGFINTISGRLFCSGTIISHRYVMSAASCFDEHVAPSDIQVQFGEYNLKKANESPCSGISSVSHIIQHPMYDPKTRTNDIALVMTRTNIDWSFAVGPICLPFHYSSNPFADSHADIIGWGTTEFMGPPSGALQKFTVNVTTNDFCKVIYSDLDDSQMCTYSPPKEDCLFDAGAPLVFKKDRLFAIAVTGVTSACGLYIPTVHTRVTAHLHWIDNIIKQGLCLK